MDNITKEAYETVQKLILESDWGKAVTNAELYSFLFSEVYEFLDGCNNRGKDNMLEEAADILMILLYIVIKNTDNPQDNQIEELLNRVNHKLRTRYSVFFEGSGNSEEEEAHWTQTKHLEKEILHYLFCPNEDCGNYAKTNRGNMLTDGSQATCLTCGYSAAYSGQNIILYTSKYRRALMDNLDSSYTDYLKGTPYFADDYFNGYKKDYIKVLRYWASNKSGSLALKDYFASRHAVPLSTFDEFLLYPLRNFAKSVLNQQIKPSRATIEINDLMMKCINTGYTGIKERFCGQEGAEYHGLWLNYIKFLLKSMILPVTYESVRPDDLTSPKDYVLHMSLPENQKADVYLTLCSNQGSGHGCVLQADTANYKLNTQVGQVLMSAVMKFNLQHIRKMRCVLLNSGNHLNRKELSIFLKDLLPTLDVIEYQ